ncbi:MAG: class I SAM-dependent methyltransferase [Oscillospiraceae bacterium]|mgnify:CR=1 FL=1|nr:class I SAM-dependent methyltransferase [Oscillospiraceae bacterium]
MARTDRYWEASWASEDPARLASFQDGWSRACGDIGALFRAHGVETICDGACGFGAYTLALAAQGFAVSAFDISPTAADITRQGLKRLGLTAEVKTASLLDTGYPDASFDAAVAASVLDHLTAADAQRALAELRRIVKPGGLLLVSFDTPEEDDLTLPHDTLPDGSFIYTEATDRAGMLFRPCGGPERTALLEGLETVWERTAASGKQTVVLAV